jgi:hypothetical protein
MCLTLDHVLPNVSVTFVGRRGQLVRFRVKRVGPKRVRPHPNSFACRLLGAGGGGRQREQTADVADAESRHRNPCGCSERTLY